jgi:uncharacterized protein
MTQFRIVLAMAALGLALAGTLPAVAQSISTSDAANLFADAEAAFHMQDYATAITKLQAAAEAGNAEAQSMLAQAYTSGTQGLPQDFGKALAWNEKAAAQGNARAFLNLGIMYRNGSGVAKDRALAITYFAQAEKAGDMKAPRYLGLIAEDTGDLTKAATFYQEGATRGDITSQFYLGRAYELGKGVTQDYTQALSWYSKSAERGDHVASDGMMGLASLYERGLGVAQNRQKAITLYQQAASTGNENAKNALQRLGVK